MNFFKLNALTVAIAATLAVDTAQAVPAAQLDLLGQNMMAAAVNNHGDVVGTQLGLEYKAWLWRNGAFTYLPHAANPQGIADASAVDLNDAGVVIGRSYGGIKGNDSPTYWINGTVTEVGLGNTSDFMAINNNGTMVIGNNLYDTVSGIWTDTVSFYGKAINDSGTAAGYQSGQNAQAALYSGGSTTLLPQYADDWYSVANAINSQGVAVGYGGNGGLYSHAVIWENGQAHKLDSFKANSSYHADTISDNGQVVGAFRDWSGFSSGAFLWTASSGMKDLNDLVDPAAGMTLISATDINEHGQIVGLAHSQDGKGFGYLLTIAESIWTGAHNGSWDDAANWDWNMRPSELQQVSLDSDTSKTVIGPAANAQIKGLALGTQNLDGYTTLKLNGGDISPESLHLMIGGKGILTGDGRINGDVYSSGKIVADNLYAYNVINQAGGVLTGNGAIHANLGNEGEIRVAAGQNLLVDGDNHANVGKMEVISGELEVNGNLTNYPNSGVIAGRNATLRFNGGLHNVASVALTGGYNDISGDIVNHDGGKIAITGLGTSSVFYDDMVNDGEIKTATGAGSIFLGTVSGNGEFTGGGQVFFEGDLRPGHSPGYMSVDGDVSFGTGNTLTMEIGGYQRGTEYDAFDVNGVLNLGGALDITLWNGFSAKAGDLFTLIEADSFLGDFSQIFFPELAGLHFDLLRDANHISLSVASTSAVPLPASGWLMLTSLLGGLFNQRRRVVVQA
ncbi:hypothetical protein IVG45_13130 [Methylomonas sp. LL1]|uniref:hypothetical protein n=1 Tax=Methylomonas sp. LL1 TaxID=2785785 RepID=UPI0018C35D65|nr:hypothetical protein [Methylomonas sp. LL1]QPK61807.1 hypothetical protein IVG45_13130 [Methylomonas sp. LL1]